MNYIDVARMMKQAATGGIPMPKAPDNTFANGIAAAQRQRQEQINNASHTYQQTTGRAFPMTNAQSNQVLDQFALSRAQAAQSARKAADARRSAFIQGQQAQARTRADRVNRTIAAQQARDKAFRASELGIQPKAEPPATRPTITPSSTNDILYGSGINPKTGVRLAADGRTILGAKTNATGSTMPAGWKQGYKDKDGWHRIA